MQPQPFPESLPFLMPLVFPLFWCAVSFLLSRFSGWRRLALMHGTDRPPRGTSFRWQSGSVGLVRYRNCLNIRAAQEGLFISVAWPFRVGHKPLLVPWSAIHDAQPQKILWRDFTKFQIGTPPIASVQIPTEVFEAPRSMA